MASLSGTALPASSEYWPPRSFFFRRPLSSTERNWISAVLILLCGVAVFYLAGALEKVFSNARRSERLFGHPAEAFMRFTGIAHFLLAFYFTASSKSMQRPGAWRNFFALLAVGTVLCAGYAWLDQTVALVASTFFFAYFFLHDIRDQVLFYHINGDAPERAPSPALREAFLWFPFFVIAAVATVVGWVAWGAIPGTEALQERTVERLPETMPWLAWLVPGICTAAMAWRLRKLVQNTEVGGLRNFLCRHRPFHVVVFGTLLILIVGAIFQYRLYSIVILHVAGWYVFTLRQLAQHKGEHALPRRFSAAWLRGTPAGFRVLHVGLAALLLVAGAVWIYAFGSEAHWFPFWVLLEEENFAYWTLLHVTVSFRPR